MDDVNMILEGPERLDEEGIAVRLRYDEEETGQYRVEYSNILQDDTVEDDWYLFGGSVGYNASSYNSESEARTVFKDVQALSGEDILGYFAVEQTAEGDTQSV